MDGKHHDASVLYLEGKLSNRHTYKLTAARHHRHVDQTPGHRGNSVLWIKLDMIYYNICKYISNPFVAVTYTKCTVLR